MNVQKMNECPDCASLNVVHNLDKEQLICRECGLIYEPTATVKTPKKAKTAKKTTRKRR